jgi:hypothetical protein
MFTVPVDYQPESLRPWMELALQQGELWLFKGLHGVEHEPELT